MLKNISKLEVTIENKVYQFLCDMDSPLQGAKEAVFQMMTYLGKIEENIKAQQAAQPAPVAPVAPQEPASDKVVDINQAPEAENGIT